MQRNIQMTDLNCYQCLFYNKFIHLIYLKQIARYSLDTQFSNFIQMTYLPYSTSIPVHWHYALNTQNHYMKTKIECLKNFPLVCDLFFYKRVFSSIENSDKLHTARNHFSLAHDVSWYQTVKGIEIYINAGLCFWSLFVIAMQCQLVTKHDGCDPFVWG